MHKIFHCWYNGIIIIFQKFIDDIRKLIVAYNCRFREMLNYGKVFERWSALHLMLMFPVFKKPDKSTLQCNIELKNIYPTIPKIQFYTYIQEKNFPTYLFWVILIYSYFA